MSQTGVVAWSKTANSNATADTNVNWSEGQAPSTVNDSARAEMASVAMWRDDIGGGLVAGGTSTAYTLTTNQTFSTLGYLNGQHLSFSVNSTNNTSATLSVDSLGAKALQINSSDALPAGVLDPGARLDVSYNSTGGYFLVHGYRKTLGNVTLGAITASSISTSGNAFFAGTLSATSDFAVNSSKFTVAAATGNTTVAGTLNVTGTITASGGVSGFIAAQSDQETATSTSLAVSPGRQQFHPSAPKAWAFVTVTAGTPALTAGYNVTDVTDISPGVTRVNFTNALSSTSYCAATSPELAGVLSFISAKAVGSVTVSTTDLAGSASDNKNFNVVVLGDL